MKKYQRVFREVGFPGEVGAEELALIEAFASGEGVLYTGGLPAIEGTSSDPDDDKSLACALKLEADCMVSGDTDLLELGS